MQHLQQSTQRRDRSLLSDVQDLVAFTPAGGVAASGRGHKEGNYFTRLGYYITVRWKLQLAIGGTRPVDGFKLRYSVRYKMSREPQNEELKVADGFCVVVGG